MSKGGETISLATNDCIITDSSQISAWDFKSRFGQLTLRIPYSRIAEHLLTPSDLVGRYLPAENTLNSLAVDFIKSVAKKNAQLTATESSLAIRHILQLIASAATAFKPFEAPTYLRVKESLLKQVKEYIDTNLYKSSLGPKDIAEAMNISVRQLHNLFTNEAESVLNFIYRRRLELCCEFLVCQSHMRTSITQIAFLCGFENASHFSRRFKAYFGMSPREYRALGAELPFGTLVNRQSS